MNFLRDDIVHGAINHETSAFAAGGFAVATGSPSVMPPIPTHEGDRELKLSGSNATCGYNSG